MTKKKKKRLCSGLVKAQSDWFILALNRPFMLKNLFNLVKNWPKLTQIHVKNSLPGTANLVSEYVTDSYDN